MPLWHAHATFFSPKVVFKKSSNVLYPLKPWRHRVQQHQKKKKKPNYNKNQSVDALNTWFIMNLLPTSKRCLMLYYVIFNLILLVRILSTWATSNDNPMVVLKSLESSLGFKDVQMDMMQLLAFTSCHKWCDAHWLDNFFLLHHFFGQLL